MTRFVRSLHRYLAAAAIGTVVLLAPGCAPDPEEKSPVAFNAAFTPLGSITIYDDQGQPYQQLVTGELRTDLPEGRYYVDFRDDQGQSAFADDGRLLFAPLVVGGELDMRAYLIRRTNLTVMALNVGEAPAFGTEALATASQPLIATNAPPGFASEASARARLVWEAAKAMVGTNKATTYQWVEVGNTLSQVNYVGDDPGAWWRMREVYSAKDDAKVWQFGYEASCRKSRTANFYGPCSLTEPADNPATYGYQGGVARGGQCKAFSNLIAYRSGVYHGDNWAFKKLPSDSSVSGWTKVKSGSLVAGDILRKPYGHSVIVVRVKSATEAVVIDSNWISGNGNEAIGTHVMSFTGNANLSDLGAYVRFNCVYTASGC